MIKTFEELNQVKFRRTQMLRKMDKIVNVCYGAGCISAGCYGIYEEMNDALKEHGLSEKIKVNQTGCIGACDLGPSIYILPDDVYYCKVTKQDVWRIVQEHILEGNILHDKCYYDKVKCEYYEHLRDIPFFNKQQKLVLKNCGVMDYHSLEAYIGNDGYHSLYHVIMEKSQQEVIDEIKESELRGRGGGGFPTGLKWELGYKSQSDLKYIICNADEGDPGAFMDRCLLEGDPHALIEGMAIGAYAIGASKGVIYIRAEYPLAVERLSEAMTQAKDEGLLGDNIFGSDFCFEIDIRIGAGAFVCGEETALMNSIEGKRGEPSQKPPFPTEEGLFGKPTVINNVETLANIPMIILNGTNWFKQYGTEKK